MKKNILLFVLAAILFEPSYSQVTRESYEKAIDILNCQSVYYSLSVISSASGVTARFITNCDCNHNPTFENIKSSIPQREVKTIEISNDIQELKSKDVSSFNKSRVVDFLINTTFDQSKSLNNFKIQLHKKEKFSDYLEDLQLKLDKVLQENIPVNTSSQQESDSELSDFDDRIRTIEKNQNSIEGKSSLLGGVLDYLVILAIILVILGLFLTLRKKDNYEELLLRILESRRLKDMIHSQNSSTSSGMRHINSTSSEIMDLQGRIRDLESKINKHNNDIEKLKQIESTYLPTHLPANQEVKEPEPKSEILFLSTPNSDGSFNESSASNTYKDGASIYRLIKTGSVYAKFQIDEKETSIKLALQYPDKNIDPVCEAENAFNSRANIIATIKMGEAELQNGKWIINSKAVIRYED